MRKQLIYNLLTGSMIATASLQTLAADRQPITKKLNDEVIMERVQLVGVIAGGKAKDAGIAVIKDAHTGKTYAIKTGDSLPGVGHIQLRSVHRELAIFVSEGKEYKIRLSIGKMDEPTPSIETTDNSMEDVSGPGLFEKWYGSRIGVGSDLISEKIDMTHKTSVSTESTPIVVIGADESKESNARPKQESSEQEINPKWKRFYGSSLDFDNTFKESKSSEEDSDSSSSSIVDSYIEDLE